MDGLLGDDGCGLLVVAAALLFVGHRATEGSAAARRLGYALGAAALVARCLPGLRDGKLLRPDAAPPAALEALLWGAAAAGLAQALLAAAAAAHRCTLGPLLAGLARAARAAAAARRERSRRRSLLPPPPDPVAERTGAADRRRRSDAIAALELFYVLHAGELAAAFPRDAFDRYVQRFLGEGEAPEAVEARARQAQESLSRHLAAPGGGHGGRALGGLQEWYAGMLRRIQAMQDLTDEARQNALSTLNEQMEERLRKLLSES